MTYSKSMGGKVRGRKTLRKNKSGKRRGNKKARRTYRRRKARGGLRGDVVSPGLMRYRKKAIEIIEENDPENEKIKGEIRKAPTEEAIYNILIAKHYPGPIIEQ